MSKNPIEVQKICKSFKEQEVLKDISFQVKPGEIYGLVGLNGIGKTTIIKIILGLLSQDSGIVQMFGTANTNINSKKKITYLPEKFMPSQFLKGHEFLELSCGYYNKDYDRKHAAEIAKNLDFNVKALDRKISSYSKGMGQKLLNVRVLLL